jgi:dethiobiotin synthetase
MIVEGVGGLLVPITKKIDLLDLILEMNLPVLLVARSGLGTLNHTRLTLEYGRSRGILFAGIILNQTQSLRTVADESNLRVLAKKTDVPIIGRFPYSKHCNRTEEGIEHSKTILMRQRKMLDFILS